MPKSLFVNLTFPTFQKVCLHIVLSAFLSFLLLLLLLLTFSLLIHIYWLYNTDCSESAIRSRISRSRDPAYPDGNPATESASLATYSFNHKRAVAEIIKNLESGDKGLRAESEAEFIASILDSDSDQPIESKKHKSARWIEEVRFCHDIKWRQISRKLIVPNRPFRG